MVDRRREPEVVRRAVALLAAAVATAVMVLPAPFLAPQHGQSRQHAQGGADENPAPREQASAATYDIAPRVTLSRKPPAAHPNAGVPLGVVIPSLGVRAAVVAISLDGGALTPPSDPRVLGWWSAGARPGAARGGALVTGHTVSTGGGAMDDLGLLSEGDTIVVRTGKGRIEYAVTGTVTYTKASLSRHAQRLFSQTGPGRLLLVTCSDWNGEAYLTNTVVLATPVT